MPADPPLLAPSGRPRPAPGVVHLGLGAFFRAHGALYLDDLVASRGGDWGVTGVSLRSPDQRERLRPQSFVYTAVAMSPDGWSPRIVEIVRDVLVAPEDPEAVIAAMASPNISIVTLTVTEKGYCQVPATGALDRSHPDIRHDLSNMDRPRTAPGFLVAALAARRAAGTAPFTVLSCDNLPENGKTARRVVLELAESIDPHLAAWIGAHGRFPCAMVDSIVPATTQHDIERLTAMTGRRDASPVMHEPFRQWVVEDDFVGGNRPDLSCVGVQLVGDVRPFELMKLRCLNGTHSALAYLGYLAGHQTIHDTVQDPLFVDYLARLWKSEIIPSLAAPPGIDLAHYAAVLLARYRNPGIRHRTWQIAMDGSQKLPQRLLATIGDNIAAGRGIDCLSLAVAAWMRYVSGVDLIGGTIDVRDPMREALARIGAGSGPAAGKVDAYLAVDDVFGGMGTDTARFRDLLVNAWQTLDRHGVHAAIAEVLK